MTLFPQFHPNCFGVKNLAFICYCAGMRFFFCHNGFNSETGRMELRVFLAKPFRKSSSFQPTTNNKTANINHHNTNQPLTAQQLRVLIPLGKLLLETAFQLHTGISNWDISNSQKYRLPPFGSFIQDFGFHLQSCAMISHISDFTCYSF